MSSLTIELNNAQLDTLIALVEDGPVWDGNVPSKTGRDFLCDKGMAVRTCVKGNWGYQVVTDIGYAQYKARYVGDTVKECKAYRLRRDPRAGLGETD